MGRLLAVDRLRRLYARIASSPLMRRLAGGAFWSVSGAVLSQAFAVAATVVIARLIGDVDFGAFSITQSTVQMFGTLAGFGAATTATKHIAELRDNDPDRAGRVLGLVSIFMLGTSGIAAVALFFSADLLAQRVLDAPHVSSLLRIAAPLLFLTTLEGAQIGVLSGFEAFRRIAELNAIRGLTTMTIAIAGVQFWGLQGALWGYVAAAAIGAAVNQYFITKEMRRYRIVFSFFDTWKERGVVLHYNLPAVIAGLSVAPVNWACNAILVSQSNGLGEMGLFAAANHWRLAVLFIPGFIARPAIPLLTQLFAQNDAPRYRTLLYSLFGSLAGLAILAAVPIALLAPTIMSLYGDDFDRGAPVLVILMATSVLTQISTIIGYVTVTMGKMWWGVVYNAIWAVVIVTLTFLFVEKGAVGLALAHMFSYLVLAALSLVHVFVFVKRFRSTSSDKDTDAPSREDYQA